ncbi:dihydroorotate dehydrogenase [Aliiroseovarius subalbicans]|uniref:dihydroorotate dehydrogenase n=1 Tax=Aliiroseovarius subalbicans TaxID=2925840 RepID=UPI001F5A4B4E|nr:dihydroorotate dehydrogenase [Aliiroseovarius subalbicans]MCI2398606.1 dihydroorotate dehydrogenase [Aliiroseovarius subalbicans]
MAKTEHDILDDAALEAFFTAGRADTPVPSSDLMARVLADAEAHQSKPRPIARPAQRRSLLAGLIAAIGGWPALAGMATATVAGVWLGFAQPDTLNALAGGTLLPGATETGYELEDLVPSFSNFGAVVEEG